MIVAAIRKDVWLLLRDRGALISLFALPIVFILAFGSMFKFGDGDHQPRVIPISYPAGSELGRKIQRAIDGTLGVAASYVPSDAEVRARVVSEAALAGIIVPADFDPAHGRRIELVLDLAGPIQIRGPLEGVLTGAVMRALAPVDLGALPAMVDVRSPPGLAQPLPEASGFQISVPGNAVLFGFFIALTTAMSFVGERRTGTWRRLLAAPVSRSAALLATLVPYYLVGLAQLGFLFGIGAGLFGMRVAGSLPALVVLSMCVSLCAVSLGLLFAAIATTEKQLGGVGSVMLLVMGLVGGCMFPRVAMPAFMKSIGLAVPHGWALDGYFDILVRQGTTIADVLPNIGALLAFAVGFLVIGLWRFRFDA
ncbi:MAG: ABC transporter permease [Proteobacteria bacterium]|nr:ABC transporter permease [Pseudomonadota bacterium]